MEDLILAGKKCCTSRVVKKDGNKKPIPPHKVSDQFVVKGRLFEIVGVQHRVIQDVYVTYLSCEGFRDKPDNPAGKQFERFFTDVMQLPRERWGTPCYVYFFAYAGFNLNGVELE
jgi:hypothetical protein